MSVNFARWSSEEECLQEMLGLHDKESAQAIVASISQRVSSDTLFKSDDGVMQIISKAGDDDIIVYGPCSWEKVDPEDDLITAKAMSSFFSKWFKVEERYQNITLNHKSFQAGIPLLKYQGADGEMYYTHVHEKGAMLISKVRTDDGLVQTTDLREKILNGTYKSYSIYGVPTDLEKTDIDGRSVNVINDIDPGDVTYCRAGMNDMANFDVVKADPEEEEDEEEGGDDASEAKAMTLEEINAKIDELRATLTANQDKIQEYYDTKPDTPDWVDTLYDENNGIYDELSAWREARVERIVEDVKETSSKGNKIDDIIRIELQPLIDSVEALDVKIQEEIKAIEQKTKPAGEEKKIDEIIQGALKPIFTSLEAMKVKIQKETKVIDNDFKPDEGKEKKIDELINEALQPIMDSVETLKAKIQEESKVTGHTPRTREEVSKAMSEGTLDTALKIRDIFKELTPNE